METLIGLVIVWIIWLVSSRRRRKWLKFPLIIIAILLILLSPPGLDLALWGLTLPLPPDRGETADAIVVLGRGENLRDNRIATVRELWVAKRAPRVFASGMMDARTIVTALKELEVPGAHLSGEGCSGSTQENALFANTLLRPQGVRKIILVTDQPHMLRSMLLFQSFRFSVIPYPAKLPGQFSSIAKFKIISREYLSLLLSGFLGRYNLRLPEELQPSKAVLDKIRDWGCFVQGIDNK